jgi:hypothetical protein
MLTLGSVPHATLPTPTPPALPIPLVLLLLLVFLVLYVRLVIYFLEDLYQPERRVSGGNKDLWALIIVLGSVVGIMAYLLVGREN